MRATTARLTAFIFNTPIYLPDCISTNWKDIHIQNGAQDFLSAAKPDLVTETMSARFSTNIEIPLVDL